MTKPLLSLYRASQLVAWGALILLLPITSLEILARWTGASTVAVPSALPLLWLTLAWFLPFVFRRGTVPRQIIPFLAFLVVALIASISAHLIDIPPFKGASVLTEQLQAILTLCVGAAFYLVVASWPRSSRRLHFTLQLINWSGILLIGWSMVQAYYILFQASRYPELIIQIQDWLSQRELFINRVTGFAFEPSWLAHQLNVLYLPFWLAATVTRYSAHRRRLFGLSLENILLVLGFATLFLSFSRIGILAAVLMITYLVIPATYRLARRITRRAAGASGGASAKALRRNPENAGFDRLNQRYPKPNTSTRSNPRAFFTGLVRAGLTVTLFGLFVVGYLVVLVGLVYGVSQYDSRLAALFTNLQWDGNGVFSIANQLAFAERLVYWVTGWQIFNDYPVLGVGLGNAGFFFLGKMPPFGWALWEVSQIFFYLPAIPNTKSLWARLLAETGWVGFSVFITWGYVLWQSARAIREDPEPLIRSVSLAGQLALVAFLVEGFSLDSFAMPYLWVALGVLTAAIDLFVLKSMH